jgi:hypothetical protein
MISFISMLYFVVGIFSLVVSFYLETILQREYYTSHAYGWPVGRYLLFMALINPKKYFKKKNFRKGYTIYLISTALMFLSICLLFIKLPQSLR